MKLIGRIILIGVGIALLVMAVPVIMGQIPTLQQPVADINEFFQLKMPAIMTVVGQGINVFAAVIAIVAALLGKKSFWLAVIAIIMIISPVYTLIVGIQNGTINGWQPILQYVGQFALPLLYFIGFLLI